MLFKMINDGNDIKLESHNSSHQLKELDLEKYIVNSANDAEALIEAIFGESLLIISNQITTKNNKRADILALDSYGNGVIIELKKEQGRLGVETQALQYLAAFSAYQGEAFIIKFANAKRDDIMSFLGDNAKIEDINRNSRIILIARNFDPTLYSMGEWLSNHNVPFKCIRYEPVCFSDNSTADKYIIFSTAFDRSKATLNPIFLNNIDNKSRKPKCFWHNIGGSREKCQEWWDHLRNKGQISTSFSNSPGDKGEEILRGYIEGDKIIAYANGSGAIGWGEITDPNSYELLEKDDEEILKEGDQRHRLKIKWKECATHIKNGIKPDQLKKLGIHHPISTSVSINAESAKKLIEVLKENFKKA